MKALGDGVMVEVAEGDVIQDGGLRVRRVEGSAILRPEHTVQMRPNEGVLLDKGAKVDLEIEVGDRVLFRWWTGVEVLLDGRRVVLTPQKNVLAKVDDGDRVEVE